MAARTVEASPVADAARAAGAADAAEMAKALKAVRAVEPARALGAAKAPAGERRGAEAEEKDEEGPRPPPIAEVSNEGLTQRDMLAFLEAVRLQDGLVDHNLRGYDELVTDGIERILTTLFDIEKRALNERAQTEADRRIKSFYTRFRFHDVKIGRPVCTTYHTGQFADLYPQRARLTGVPYSGPVTAGATVVVRAYFEDGRVEEKTAEIPTFQIGGFPVMVKGVNCHTRHATRAALKALGEDPSDPGGYFIAKRGEWVVDLLENIRYNSVHIHAAMKPNEHVRAEFLSQPGGAFENSSMIRIRLMTSGQLTVEINSVKFEKVRIPFYIIYRLFGMTDDRDVAATIVFDVADGGPVTKRVLEHLERAFHLADPAFAPLAAELNRERLVHEVAKQVAKYLTSPGTHVSNESAIAYLNEDLLGSPSRPGGLDRILLPHLGQTAEARIRKLRYLGLLIHKLFLVHLGVLPPTDRDSYRHKRVHGAGVSLAKAFKTQVNNSVVIPIARALRRELRNNPWEAITERNLVDTFRNTLATGDLNRAMEQAITSGNKTIVVRRRAAVNRVSSQALERKNPLNTLSALRSIVTQNAGNASKQTERADMMRRVHATYTGVICPAHSPDTGENVGMRKQLAITASVCSAGEALPLARLLAADPAVTPLDRVDSAAMLREGLARVFVNGNWVGCCPAAHELAARYRARRRAGRGVDPFTTVYHDPVTDEVEFWLDAGRLRRPLLIVDNNLAAYDAALRARHAHAAAGGDPAAAPPRVAFVQNVRFTPAHVREILGGRLTLGDLVRDGVAEYVTPEEQENVLLAHSVVELRAERGNHLVRYTHCDVEQAIFGLASLLAPYANHTQPARITLHTNQTRQAGGWYSLGFPWRTDKNRFFQFYNEWPLVATYVNRLIPPYGMNTMVAYASYGGDNQEDSAIVNQASADRGLFGGAFFRFEIAELEKGESFGNPDPLTTKNLKPNASYDKLADGFIRVGAVARYGDVLVGRVAKLARGRAGADERFQFTDRSVVYRNHEPAVVEGVFRPRGANDELFGIVKLRHDRPLRTGDKMCLTTDHDVLTGTRGWVPIASVTLADTVACLIGGRLVYQPPTAVYAFEVDEDVYEIRSQMVNQRVTLNHRMWVKPRGSAGYQHIEARQIAGKRVQYLRNAENVFPDQATYTCWGGEEGDPDLDLPMDAWLKILGAFIADGFVDKRSASYTAIAMKKARKIAYLDAALLGTGLRHWHRSDKYIIAATQVRRALAPLSVGALAKSLPPYVWTLSQRQARVLLDALVQGDGHRSRTGVMYYTSSRALANDVQRLALHAGWSGNILVHNLAGDSATLADGRTIVASVDSWRISIVSSKNSPMVNHGHVHTQNAQTERITAYAGPVHCVTVPGGVFYVRRGDVPGWTGNSSRSGNKCLSADHDALTESRGWVPIGDVTEADAVATLVGGRLEYARPSAVHAYDHCGPMCAVETAAASLLVTPNHRMYATPRGDAAPGFHLAEDLAGVPARYHRAAANVNAAQLLGGTAERTRDLLALIGCLAAGPGFGRTRAGRVIIVRQHTPEYVAALAKALGGLGLVGVEPPGGGAFIANVADLGGLLAPLGAATEGRRRRLPACVWQLGQAQALDLLTAALGAAALLPPAPVERDLADDIQRLALHAGTAAVLTPQAGGFAVRLAPEEEIEDEAAVEAAHYEGRVHCLTVPGGVFMVRRRGRPAWTGNSIVASMLQQSDMPFTEDGQTPDIIVNTHSIPSRMTIGQLIETEVAQVCARKGAVADGTAFLPVDHLGIAKELKAAGLRYNGRHRMYNGLTGEYFDAAIFMGPTAQQRLQKFVLDDEQAVGGSGPTDATTGQPLRGKSVHGGLRLGEMERWSMTGQGCMRNMQEKVSIDSDGRTAYVCRGCGTYAVCNEFRGIYRCRICRELADLAAVDTTKSALLLHEELAAAGIGQVLGLRPRRFEEGPSADADF